MDLLVGGIAALIAAAGGIYITVHEVRRRERRVTRREIDDLVDEVEHLVTRTGDLEAVLLEQRRHIYKLTALMIDAGLDPPRPPDPSFDPGEYD